VPLAKTAEVTRAMKYQNEGVRRTRLPLRFRQMFASPWKLLSDMNQLPMM
jgi:hypothetical protein